MALQWQLSKRLEKGRFVWPSAKEGKIALTPAQLAMLLEGIDWRLPQRSWKAQVILPITDPYVAHHGALGAFATIHLPADADHYAVAQALAGIEGMDRVLTRDEACKVFDLPTDRIGDLVVTCVARKALGTAEEEHDLTGLDVPLRSHGGLDEQVVPFIVNGAMNRGPNSDILRNYDAWITAVATA